MISKNHLKTLGAGLAAIVLATGCGDDEAMDPTSQPTTPGSIVEVAAAAGKFNTLLSAATTAGLADTLSNDGPFTVFAPTDAAFSALGSGFPSDPNLLANILLSHVVAGSLDSTAVTSRTSIDTLAGTSFEVSGLPLSAQLDIEAKNGIIHVLDEVIVPPAILDAAAANAELSTLVTAVGAASSAIQGALAAPGPITVFAPVNSAFAKIPSADLDALLADQPALDAVLSYHVVSGQVLSSDLSDGQTVQTVNGDSFKVSLSASGASLTDANGNTINIIGTDIRLLNGTVHLIDAVLLPKAEEPQPGTVVEVAQEAGSFTTLLGAASDAGLADALDNGGPFTVFAPSDAAFSALGVNLAPVDTGVIANILLHHVVGEKVESSEVLAKNELMTLANTTLSVDTSGSDITIGGSSLSSNFDVMASTGVIHIMDEVIVPPSILEVAQNTSALSTLVTAVGAASSGVQAALAPDTLAGDSPITVFAPTNDAFTASGIDLQNTPQAILDAVLAHHAVGAQALSSDLSNGQTVTTLNGDVTIEIDENGNIGVIDGQGNKANVIATLKDIRTLTGVVHVIDAVLLHAN